MSIPQNRTWMYDRLTRHRHVKPEFEKKLQEFLDYASGWDEYKNNNNKMRCPCARCYCLRGWLSKETVQVHLLDNGFMEGYYVWRCHGEMEEFARSYGSSSRRGGEGPGDEVSHSNRRCMMSQAPVSWISKSLHAGFTPTGTYTPCKSFLSISVLVIVCYH